MRIIRSFNVDIQIACNDDRARLYRHFAEKVREFLVKETRDRTRPVDENHYHRSSTGSKSNTHKLKRCDGETQAQGSLTKTWLRKDNDPTVVDCETVSVKMRPRLVSNGKPAVAQTPDADRVTVVPGLGEKKHVQGAVALDVDHVVHFVKERSNVQ